MRRHRLVTPAIIVWLLLVAAWAAGIQPGDPWQPAQSYRLQGAQLAAIQATLKPVADGAAIADLGHAHMAVQSWKLRAPIDAGRMPVLHYQVSNFPRTLELALLFRTGEHPENVHAISLPWPGHGAATFDLSAAPRWRGSIIELGFSQYPTPGLVPPDVRFSPFVLHGATLESASITGLWQALATRWVAWTPWSTYSINANRATSPYGWRGSPNLILALMLGGALLIAALFGLLRQGRWRVALPLVLLAWVALDVRWLSQLQRNQALAEALFQGKPWQQRQSIVADRPLLQRAAVMREALARQADAGRVLYWTPGRRHQARLGYFLRPFNVALLPVSLAPSAVPDGSLLLIDNRDGSWNWDLARHRLWRQGQAFQGTLVWRHDQMFLLRKGAGSAP